VWANQFAKFVGTYVPVGKSVDQSFGRSDCNTYGFSGLTEFKIYETSGQYSFSQKGIFDHSGSLVEFVNSGQRFQKQIYISGDETQATRQEVFFDFLHSNYSSISITISALPTGKYSLKYASYFSNEMENVHSACLSEIEVVQK
jgi:hypothetical protein